MNKVTIAFADFWDGFNPETQWFYPLIAKEFETSLVSPIDNPDILFYSCFGNQNLYSKAGIKIYFSGENDIPDFNMTDYAISFHNISFGSRHLRLPLYAMYPCFDILRTGNREPAKIDRDFCSFVVSNKNHAAGIRTEFFELLSKYKHVASGGRYLNNIGGPVDNKHEFLTKYKFNIAFENSSVDGYTTEKLVDALAAGTLPIYWGNPRIEIDFPRDCYIDISDFKTLSEAVEYIEKVDNNDKLYSSYFETSPHEHNPYLNWEEILMSFIRPILLDRHSYLIHSGWWQMKLEDIMFKERLNKIGFFRKTIDKFEKLAAIKNSIYNIIH